MESTLNVGESLIGGALNANGCRADRETCLVKDDARHNIARK
jgi:hypothetical protein